MDPSDPNATTRSSRLAVSLGSFLRQFVARGGRGGSTLPPPFHALGRYPLQLAFLHDDPSADSPALATMNTAFVFAKPHANTPAVLEVIKAKFGEKAINVLQEGVVTGEEIDSKGYIDQHYYAIAEKSTLTSGKDLPVNAEKFESVFGEDWKTVVSEGRALNALEFKKKFAIYQAEGALDKAWDETNVEKKTRVKLGGGFYCGQIEVEGLKCARHER